MLLRRLQVQNFRALDDVDVEFSARINVIVGPNASGKTTVLEAIRLIKAWHSPRMPNETVQVLVSLGAASPHNVDTIIGAALARDISKPVVLKAKFQITQEEFDALQGSADALSIRLILSRNNMIGNPAAFNAFMSSTSGRNALLGAKSDIKRLLDEIQNDNLEFSLGISLNFLGSGSISSESSAGILLTFLDQKLPPNQTIFSYFPADRAIPPGEPGVQLGAADASQQLESHNSQPHLKFTRLKNTVFNSLIMGEDSRAELRRDFERILGTFLKGRSLSGVGINNYGQLSIRVKDDVTNKEFEFDALSSGEKGIILTFFLIERSLVDGGLFMIDEPELHLNPAICRNIIPFIIDNYIDRKNLQAIICSHSPEIIAGALEREGCAIFHVVSERRIAPIRPQDQYEIQNALSRLGSSVTEGLLHRATLFVEGDDDVALLEDGFPNLLQKIKLVGLGGRKEVEREIRDLQAAEKSGREVGQRYFLFDRDDSPTNLQNSEKIRVKQWTRRCLENYIIEPDAIYAVLRDRDICVNPAVGYSDVAVQLKALAMEQINDMVYSSVYASYGFDNPGLRPAELLGKSIEDAASVLFGRADAIAKQLSARTSDEWKQDFYEKCRHKIEEMKTRWDSSWKEECDGKRLIEEMHRERKMKISVLKFKRLILLQMKAMQPRAEGLSVMEAILRDLVGGT